MRQLAFISLFICLFVSTHLFANTLSVLQSKYPTEYAETKESCTQWANDDGVEENISGYINQCIIDQIGYLADDMDTSGDEAAYQATDSYQAEPSYEESYDDSAQDAE